MRKKLICFIIVAVFLCLNVVNAQNSAWIVTGVVAEQNGESLPGVSIVIKGTGTGTITDMDGRYSVECDAGAVLVFSYVGYETQAIAVSSGQMIVNVEMIPTTKMLDEMVVVGYGMQSRRLITSSIAKVDGKVLKNIPITSIGDGLKGKIAGVRVHTSNSTPGGEASFTVRGGSSISLTNAPLVLVDGVERPYSGINPNDVESIEVLKDAASTAIYGARASNGVVLITTRKGVHNQRPRITFDINMALQQPESLVELMNARDYINTMRPVVARSKYPKRNDVSGFSASSGNDENSLYSTRYLLEGESVPNGYHSMPDPLDPSKTLIFQDNNMQDLLFRNTLWQNYYVGIDGGTENVSYMASLGYLQDNGVALGTGYKRASAKINTDFRITEKLSAKLGVDFARTMSNEFSSQSNEISRAMANPPTQKLYYEDGRPTPGYNAAAPNPLWTVYMNDRTFQKNYTSLFAEIDYYILDGLRLNVSGSYYGYQYQYDGFQKANEFNTARPATSNFQETERGKVDAFLAYDKTFANEHNLSLMVGASYQKDEAKTLNASAEGGSTDKITTIVGPNMKSSSKIEQKALFGSFGRLNYDYKRKYLFSATFRYDGSSLFLPGNRWGFFPGVSAGWVMSEEGFMQGVRPIDFLKLRVSYGQTGNNNIGYWNAMGGYSPTAQYNGEAGIVPSVMPNGDLTWETTTQLDLGFDLNLLKNRIRLRADYFNKITENLLFEKQLPNTTGFSSVFYNIGKVRFRGFDLELTTCNIERKHFVWETKLTWSFIKNLVLELPDNGRDRNRIGGITLDDGTAFGGTAEGEPLYRYYGYVVDRILETDEEAAVARPDHLSNRTKQAGDYEWKDRDGDGKITAKDQYELGVTVPHTTGGLNNTLRYKNFTLSIYLDWALGHYINDENYMRYFMATFNYNYALAEEAKEAWQQPGDNTPYARLTADDPNDGSGNYKRRSSVFNRKGDYLCIRDISLQYRLPVAVIQKIGMEELAITLSGSNLHFFSATKGINPEVGTASTYEGYNAYPAVRRFSLGLKATF